MQKIKKMKTDEHLSLSPSLQITDGILLLDGCHVGIMGNFIQEKTSKSTEPVDIYFIASRYLFHHHVLERETRDSPSPVNIYSIHAEPPLKNLLRIRRFHTDF